MYHGRGRWVNLLGILIMMFGSAIYAADNAIGTSSLNFLKLPVGSRQAALGRGGITYTDDALTLRYNPANLTEINQYNISGQHAEMFQGMNQEFVAFAMPWQRNWGFGASLDYFGSGSIDRTLTDAGGNYAGSAGTYDNSDLGFTVGAGYSVSDYLSVGANLKYLREKLDDVSASAVAIDAGVTCRPIRSLRLAATIRNLGTKMKFINQTDPLPLIATIGADYRPFDCLMLTADVSLPRDNDILLSGGIEYWPVKYVALRIGYDSLNDADNGFSAGLGFTYESIDIDYAFIPFGDLGNTHRISAGFSFGPARAVPTRFNRRHWPNLNTVKSPEIEIQAPPPALAAALAPVPLSQPIEEEESIAYLQQKLERLRAQLAALESGQ